MFNYVRFAAIVAMAITTPASLLAAETPTVVALSGKATIRHGQELRIGSDVAWGSEVLVDAGAQLTILGPDFSTKVWGPAAFVVERSSERRNMLSLLFGRLIAAFAPGSDAAVSTRSAVAGVRGTVVYAEDTVEAPDYHCLCEGEVEYRHRHSGKRQIHRSRNHDVMFRAGSDGFDDDPVKMRNHGDADVADVKRVLAKR